MTNKDLLTRLEEARKGATRDHAIRSLLALAVDTDIPELVDYLALSHNSLPTLIQALRDAREGLEFAQRKLSDVREEWWGHDSFIPEHVTEKYLQQIGEAMTAEATEGFNAAQETLTKLDKLLGE